jgi:hypothetical protein
VGERRAARRGAARKVNVTTGVSAGYEGQLIASGWTV